MTLNMRINRIEKLSEKNDKSPLSKVFDFPSKNLIRLSIVSVGLPNHLTISY